MAENLTLQVTAETKSAEDRLKALQKVADQLAYKKVTIAVDENKINQITRKTSMFGQVAKSSLELYKQGIINADQANMSLFHNIDTATNKAKSNMQSLIDGITGVERETSQITSKTSMFGRVSDEVFTSYTSGVMSGADATQTLSKDMKTLGSETQKTSGIFDSLTKRFTAANLVSAAVTFAVSKLRQALREAVSEMKEMDKELTTIKMVTGASDYDISKLTEQAFAGARANGRSVNDYLTAAERFARAGYRDNIDQLSKLSLMTQNIGGVEEDTAAKFLLAADAAWKLNGSYDALMGVLDGVSSVADQNATDLSKIAEGITVAGSAFANAGESAATFTAMLGVTTASTQRSGSEMARGLRTILFRVRQVKAEFDDGEIVDTKSISNAAKALEDVGISVLDETGDLKSMSQILTELSGKWGTLSKSQQSYLQNYLAGNRNGNVLFALMDNWGAYEKMLSQYEESSGTALEKNAEYTDSWAAATDNLKTSWTELISTLTDNGSLFTDLIKAGTFLVQGFNELAKNNANTKAADSLISDWERLTKEWQLLNMVPGTTPADYFDLIGRFITSDWAEVSDAYKAAEKYQRDGKKRTEELAEAIKDYSGAADGATDSTDDLSDASEEATNAFERQRKKISEVAKAIKEEKSDAVNSLADIYKAAMDAADKGYYGSNAYRQGGALFFSAGNLDKLEKEGKLSARTYLDAYFTEAESGNYSEAAAKFFENITGGSNAIKNSAGEILASVRDIGEGYKWTFDLGSRSMEEYLQSLQFSTGIGEAFWASMIESLGMYSDELAEWQKKSGEGNGKIESKADLETTEAEEKAETLQEKYDKLREKVFTKVEAQTAQAEKDTALLIDTLNRVPKFITTQINVVTKMTASANRKGASGSGAAGYAGGGGGIQMIYEGGSRSILGRMGYASGKRDRYSGIALVNDEYPANGSTPELIISKSQGMAYIANGGRPALVNLASDDIVLTARETKSAFGVPGFPVGKNVEDSFLAGRGGKSTITPKEKSGTANDTAVGTTASTDPTDTWNQLKKLIDYMVEEQKGILDQNLKVLDKQLEELEATRKAQKTEDELSEKQLAVDEALLDLQKAQNERTVRYYNESTQQWEWMADQGALAKAEEAYSDALKDLNDFLAELDFNEQKAAIQAQKDALQEAFDAYKEGWDLIVKSIEKPTGDLAALFEELKTNGTDAMKAQAGNIESLLGALEVGFFSGIGDVTDAATSGVSAVVQRANDFLESVKRTEEAKSTEQNKASSSGGSGGGGNGQGTVQKQTAATQQLTKEASKSVVLDSLKAGGVPVTYGVGGPTSVASSGLAKNNLTLADAGVLNSTIKSMTSTVNNNGNNTYINGVRIGSEMINQPFGKVLSVLSIHSNGAR